MGKNWLRKVWSGYESFAKFRLRVVAWFVRLAWLPILIWGCIDLAILWTQPLSSAQAGEKVDDAAIRLIVGSVLFLVWFFIFRRH
jgi:hypothetical protein